MKTFISLIACSLAAFLIASAAVLPETTPPLQEFWVKVNPTNWLAASDIRFVPSNGGINPTNGLPVYSGTIEAWGEDVDNGVTNKSIIKRHAFTPTPAQLNAWNSQSGTNGFTWLTAAILQKTKLTPRP